MFSQHFPTRVLKYWPTLSLCQTTEKEKEIRNSKKNGGELSMVLWVCVVVSWGMTHSSSPSVLCQSAPPQLIIGHSWPGV